MDLADVIVHLEDCCGSHMRHVDLSCIFVCLILLIMCIYKKRKYTLTSSDYSTSFKARLVFHMNKNQTYCPLSVFYIFLSCLALYFPATHYFTGFLSVLSPMSGGLTESPHKTFFSRTGSFSVRGHRGKCFWPCRPPRLCAQSCLFTALSVQSLSRVRLCNSMNRSTPGLPIHHQLPEFIQTHILRVGDAIQPSHPLSSPSPPASNPSQHQSLFQ